MAYASKNFKTKKAFKEAVAAGHKITLWSPGPFAQGQAAYPGKKAFVEGPWYPQPHRWYAEVKMTDGFVVSVK